MPIYHCANDPVFGYCKTQPDYDVKPDIKSMENKQGTIDTWTVGGHCRLNKSTCGNFATHIESVPLKDPKLVFTLKAPEQKIGSKKKSKKDKPMQGEFFS
jgi:hypothetical protein